MTDHISYIGLAGMNPLVGQNDDRFGPRFPAPQPCYDPEVYNVAFRAREQLGIKTTFHQGTYMSVAGPMYETKHEVALCRVVGGDTIGMSTVFEVAEAAHCGLKVLGLSIVTNRSMGPGDDFQVPTHAEVLETVTVVEKDLTNLVRTAASLLPDAKYADSDAYKHFEQLFQTISPSDYLLRFPSRCTKSPGPTVTANTTRSLVLVGGIAAALFCISYFTRK